MAITRGRCGILAIVPTPRPDADPAGVADDVDGLGTRILDAARDLLCRTDAQRVTMEDVARAADVARITVYRRFAAKDVLVERVVSREFARYFRQFAADVAECETAADRVVVGFVSSLRTMRDNELISRLMTAEHGQFASSIVGEHGRTLATVRGFVAQQLRREQAAGNIAVEIDADLVAEIMVRLSTSFLVTPSEVVDIDDAQSLRAVAERALLPILGLSS